MARPLTAAALMGSTDACQGKGSYARLSVACHACLSALDSLPCVAPAQPR